AWGCVAFGSFPHEWFVPPRWGSGDLGCRKPGVALPSAAPPLAIIVSPRWGWFCRKCRYPSCLLKRDEK
ncbi:MAG: hypothetical protein MJZ22_05885, partial [Candidatus Saccharibacteria bacterium]|nr:hypothetical protein [Candidatus Saccharibacteria bacterium]